MTVIFNEVDMFNHIKNKALSDSVEMEPKEEFLRGMDAMEPVLKEVSMARDDGKKVIAFSHDSETVKIEWLEQPNLYLTDREEKCVLLKFSMVQGEVK